MLDETYTSSKVYTYPDTQMQVEVILASQTTDPRVPTLYTVRMRYPRIIHAEAKTHRVMSLTENHFEVLTANLSVMDEDDFSRNARSSRAVPVNTMINEVKSNPFVPWHWGQNQKGMQAGEELLPITKHICIQDWINASTQAWLAAEELTAAGVHKQIPNRLLEPFSYIDVLITATEWKNFLWLRDHKDAEPHLQDLARMVKQALEETKPQIIDYVTGWHLPYVTQSEISDRILPWAFDNDKILSVSPELAFQRSMILAAKISAARCARISYKPFDGNDSYERELERFASLVGSDRVHASPMEHQAMPDANQAAEHKSNLRNWNQFRKLIPNEFVPG